MAYELEEAKKLVVEAGKKLVESAMQFRREGVPMGLPGLDEWHIPQTDADAVRAAKAALLQ